MDEVLQLSGALLQPAFEAVAHATADGVLLLDREANVTFANRAALRILGPTTSVDIVGTDIAMLAPSPEGDSWRSVVERARAGEEVHVAEVSLRRAGLDVSVSMTVVGLLAPGGDTAGFCVVVRDRTEEVVAQQTLLASEQRVRRSESLARTGSFVFELDQDAVQWSSGMYDIFGISPTDFEGTLAAHLELVHPDDRQMVAQTFRNAIRSARAYEVDHRAVLGDGAISWVFTVVEPVADVTGHVQALRGVCQDVTVRKDSEERLRSALQLEQMATNELRRADALKDQFLGTVSHELRTPLTSLIGFSSLLLRRLPEHHDALEPIVRNAREMQRMIEKLLDYCRLQAGQVPIQPQPVQLRAVVDKCFEQLSDVAAEQLRVNAVDPDLEIVADRDGLERILGNLVGNAVRYAGSDAQVTVDADRLEDAVRISVVDNGPGIAAEHQEQLFDRFYRVPGAGRRGTGIGLAIALQYAEHHGGTVTCESAPGAGAAFRVIIPQPRPAPE